ncbi:MAG: hypothetical protein K6G03_00215 [Lachnospiraceae bacterium]|nr:hypothetical protein [Lachnospiraceae bacterium]
MVRGNHMGVIPITEENISQYAGNISSELFNEFKREYFKGLVYDKEVTDKSFTFIIWNLKNVEDEDTPTEAEILWIQAEDQLEGEELLTAFYLEMNNNNVKRISFEFESLNNVEKSILTGKGFEIKEAESRDLRVSVGELYDLEINQRERSIPEYIKSLSDISEKDFKNGILECVFHGRYGILDDLPLLPMTYYDPDISTCIITDNKVNGFILVHKTLSGEFIVELLFCMPPDASENLLHMIRHSVRLADEVCEKEDIVILRRHNKATHGLCKKLFPEKKGVTVLKGETRI